jgi:hypothetical protein
MREGTAIWAPNGVPWTRESLTEMTVLKMTEGKKIWE